MVELKPHVDGVLLPIRAQPGGKRNELRSAVDGHLKVVVTQVAEAGKANQAIVKVLAKTLNPSKSHIELLNGQKRTSKVFLIRDITVTELRKRISMAIPS